MFDLPSSRHTQRPARDPVRTDASKPRSRALLCTAQFPCDRARSPVEVRHAAVQQNLASSALVRWLTWRGHPVPAAASPVSIAGNAKSAWRARAGRGAGPRGLPSKEMTMNQVTITADGFSKVARDAAEFGRANLEAVAQSAQAYAQATQALSRQALALAQDLNT